MLVIGLTGSMGAGKKLVKEFLGRKFSITHVVLSDVIWGQAQRKKQLMDRKTLQDMGNDLRRQYGSHILAKLATEYLSKKDTVLIDGIRNPGEVEFLRQKYGGNFKLIAVDAPQEVRFQRLQKRAILKDPKNWDEFLVADARDQGEGEPEWGLQVKKCLEMADFKIVNDGDDKQLMQKVDEIIQQIG